MFSAKPPAHRANLSLLAGLLILAGCNAETRLANGPQADPVWYDIPSHEIVAKLTLPAGLQPLQARERYSKPNWFEQRIVFSNNSVVANENYLHIKVAFSEGETPLALFGFTGVQRFIRPMTDTALAAKLQREFPAMETQISNTPEQNRFGPFLWANTVEEAETHCTYSWQYADDDRQAMPAGVHAVWVELRICDPQAGTRENVAAMQSLTLNLVAKNRLSPLYQPLPGWQNDQRRLNNPGPRPDPT